MEGDLHELRIQEKQAEEELAKQPEQDRATLAPVLEIQKQRTSLFLNFISELQALHHKYDSLYEPLYSQRFELSKSAHEFWLKAMRNNSLVSTMIFDQDFELLRCLTNIRHISEPNSDNFTLEFHFLQNPVMHNSLLTKKYIVGPNDNPIRGEGCEIKWKGASLTQKIKKTKKKGKNKKVQTKVEKIPSFFQFFNTVTEDTVEDDSEEGAFSNPLEEDYENACEFRDEIVPNAVYYYLGVVDQEDSLDDASDDGKKPKAKKVDAAGTEKADCKPQ
jgi:nucleosome assembly protein 1-like 1